jgi:hypothetical protein
MNMNKEADRYQGMPWIINAIGAGFIGFAIGGCGDMALTYLQDSYQLVSSSRLQNP